MAFNKDEILTIQRATENHVEAIGGVIKIDGEKLLVTLPYDANLFVLSEYDGFYETILDGGEEINENTIELCFKVLNEQFRWTDEYIDSVKHEFNKSDVASKVVHTHPNLDEMDIEDYLDNHVKVTVDLQPLLKQLIDNYPNYLELSQQK